MYINFIINLKKNLFCRKFYEFFFLSFHVIAINYRMCAMLLPELASFAAAMLFAVHPIHTEAVSYFFFTICE